MLQRIAFKHYGDTPFKDFAFLSTSAVGKRDALAQHLASLDDAALKDIGLRAKVLNNNSAAAAAKAKAAEEMDDGEAVEATPSRAFLLEVCTIVSIVVVLVPARVFVANISKEEGCRLSYVGIMLISLISSWCNAFFFSFSSLDLFKHCFMSLSAIPPYFPCFTRPPSLFPSCVHNHRCC